MNPPNTSEPAIQELGGEPIDGSGFESEEPTDVFQPYEDIAEGAVQ
jgi:hypothetical protein